MNNYILLAVIFTVVFVVTRIIFYVFTKKQYLSKEQLAWINNVSKQLDIECDTTNKTYTYKTVYNNEHYTLDIPAVYAISATDKDLEVIALALASKIFQREMIKGNKNEIK